MIIKTSPDEIQNYLTDASNLKGFCDAVYFPENEKDVIDILKEANNIEEIEELTKITDHFFWSTLHHYFVA